MKALHITLFRHQACWACNLTWSHEFYASIQPLLPWYSERSRCTGYSVQIITASMNSSFLGLPVESWAAFQGHYTNFGFLSFCTEYRALLACLWALDIRDYCGPTVSHPPFPTPWLLKALLIWSHWCYSPAALSMQAKAARGPGYCCLALRERWKTRVNMSALLTFKSVCWS